ncbi:MAG: glycosyltransferase [Pseudomonadota bacterium]
MSRIPSNLIVFFHDKSAMPDEFQQCVDESLATNPDFELIFLDDESAGLLIDRHFPQFQGIFSRIRIPAARSDLARLVALHHFGGIYTDASMAFRTPFHRLFREEDELFLVRRDDNPAYKGRPEAAHIINGIIGASARSDFVLDCLKRVYFNVSGGFINYTVHVATGPNVITEAYFARRNEPSFSCTVADYSALSRDNFTNRRISGVNNSWVETQVDGILRDDGPNTESPHDRAWRAFSEKREPWLQHVLRRIFPRR